MAVYAAIYGIGRATMLTLYEMDEATGAGEEKEDDVIVYVNGFSVHDDQFFHDAAESYLEARHGKRKKSIGISASSLEDLTAKLKTVRKEHGQIKKLEFFGHGNQATIFFQHQPVGESHLVGDAPKLKGIFASDAKIVLNTCWTTRGEQGPHFLKALGENFLDQGGSIVGTEVTFAGTPNLIADLAAMPYLAWRGAKDALDHAPQKPLRQYLTRPKILTLKVEPRPFEETKLKPTF